MELIIVGALIVKFVICAKKPEDKPTEIESYHENLIENIN